MIKPFYKIHVERIQKKKYIVIITLIFNKMFNKINENSNQRKWRHSSEIEVVLLELLHRQKIIFTEVRYQKMILDVSLGVSAPI